MHGTGDTDERPWRADGGARGCHDRYHAQSRGASRDHAQSGASRHRRSAAACGERPLRGWAPASAQARGAAIETPPTRRAAPKSPAASPPRTPKSRHRPAPPFLGDPARATAAAADRHPPADRRPRPAARAGRTRRHRHLGHGRGPRRTPHHQRRRPEPRPERHGRAGRQPPAGRRRRGQGTPGDAVREGGRLLRGRAPRDRPRPAHPRRRRPGRRRRRAHRRVAHRRLRRVPGADRPRAGERRPRRRQTGRPRRLPRGHRSPPGPAPAEREEAGGLQRQRLRPAVRPGPFGPLGPARRRPRARRAAARRPRRPPVVPGPPLPPDPQPRRAGRHRLRAARRAPRRPGARRLRRPLHGARRDAFDSVVALSRARAIAYDANADESRYLLDPSAANSTRRRSSPSRGSCTG